MIHVKHSLQNLDRPCLNTIGDVNGYIQCLNMLKSNSERVLDRRLTMSCNQKKKI